MDSAHLARGRLPALPVGRRAVLLGGAAVCLAKPARAEMLAWAIVMGESAKGALSWAAGKALDGLLGTPDNQAVISAVRQSIAELEQRIKQDVRQAIDENVCRFAQDGIFRKENAVGLINPQPAWRKPRKSARRVIELSQFRAGQDAVITRPIKQVIQDWRTFAERVQTLT